MALPGFKWLARLLGKAPEAAPHRDPATTARLRETVRSLPPRPTGSTRAALKPAPAPTRVARHIMPDPAPAPRPVDDANTQILGAMVGYQILSAQTHHTPSVAEPTCAPPPSAPAADTSSYECAAPSPSPSPE